MSPARLVAHQLRYDLLVTWRNPQSRFFSLALPVIFMVLLTSVFGNGTYLTHGHRVKISTYYVPGISTLGIVSVSLVNLVNGIVTARESGILKRRRSTPVPAWVLIASRALTSVILSILLVVILVAIGRVGFGVQLPGATIPAFALSVAVGAVCFCCLAFALASFMPSEDSAQPTLQAIVLPLYFISGVFIPASQLSSTLRGIAGVFPVRHLDDALFKAFDPATEGSGFAGHDLLIVGVWGVAGLIVALRRFSWAPRST